MEFFANFLETDSFPPRWPCGTWSSGHGWLHICSDLATFAAYMTIPFVLLYFLRKRPDLPFPRIFYMFALFIFACGTVHGIEAVIFWWPVYRVSGVFKLLTAIVSWGTVIQIFKSAPRALRMRMAEELEAEILQRRRVEEQLLENQQLVIQSERLSAIGQAMTGLIHESRNALARSQAGLRLLAREVKSRDELLELIEESLSAQHDLKQLFEVVRQYAVPPPIQREEARIPDLVDGVFARVSDTLGLHDAKIEHKLLTSDVNCHVDKLLMENVFRNLIENSFAACADPLRLSFTYSDAEIGGAPAIEINYLDNGPGMRPEEAKRAFEAFYTTKMHGTGLGLAICQQTVQSHGGTISLNPEREHGAEFAITLLRQSQ